MMMVVVYIGDKQNETMKKYNIIIITIFAIGGCGDGMCARELLRLTTW
jgi:hypothetical protein